VVRALLLSLSLRTKSWSTQKGIKGNLRVIPKRKRPSLSLSLAKDRSIFRIQSTLWATLFIFQGQS
jgi:hypothetical protein